MTQNKEDLIKLHKLLLLDKYVNEVKELESEIVVEPRPPLPLSYRKDSEDLVD
jgi:hypothetical protein